MSMGSILLQPAKLKRASGSSPSTGLMEEVLDLMVRIVVDGVKGGDIFKTLEEAARATANRMSEHVSARFDGAWSRLRDWTRSFRDGIEEFAQTIPDSDDTLQMAGFGMQLITKLTEKAANLSIEQVRGFISELLDIFENEWGFSNDFIQQQVWEMLDDLAAHLEQVPAGAANGDRKNRRQMASTLRRIKKKLDGQFTFPGFNADKLAGDLMEFLKGFGAETVVKKAACYGKNAEAVFSAVNALADLVPYTGFGPNTVGAAEACSDSDEKYLWYASWLLGGPDVEWYDWFMFILFSLLQVPYPPDGFFIKQSDNTVIRKKFFGDVKTIGSITNEVWEQVTPLSTYSYNGLDAKTIENWAKHTAYPCDFVEMLFHGISIESGDWLANVLNMALLLADGIVKPATCKPIFPQLVFSIRILNTILGTLPGIHTTASFGPALLHWLTKAGTTGIEANLYHALIHGIRNALLSIFTLVNHNDPGGGANPPENYKQVGGIVTLVTGLLTSQGLVKLVPKKNYGFRAFGGGSGVALEMWLGWWIGGSAITGLIGATVGTLLGQGIARNSNTDLWKGKIWVEWVKQWGIASAVTLLSSPISYYMSEEGDTKKGTYNPTSANQFNGYPDHTSSPYKLPFRRGKTVRCIQGNQGIWSHNNFGSPAQVYAYDFDLDQDDDVLASRGGTVVDYFDWVPDDKNVGTNAPGSPPSTVTNQTSRTNWNFILIRHDTVDTTHDKDEGGNPATTYCVYGHGRQGSVRAAFNTRSVAPTSIIGTVVNQGDVIMKAGNTGNSMYNHLHIDVRPGPPLPSTPSANPAVGLSSLHNRTIPFVFRDAVHKAPLETIFFKFKSPRQDGVPESLNWYESDNG